MKGKDVAGRADPTAAVIKLKDRFAGARVTIIASDVDIELVKFRRNVA